MDIVTHAGIGLVAAAPFVGDRPELGLGVVAGSVLPDLDALYRLVHKRAFLQGHQTWTHAFPVQLGFSIAVGTAATLAGWNGLALGAGLLAGLAGHSLLDWTNTFGVALFKPISPRRFCGEWVFFIDAAVVLGTAIALAWVIPGWLRGEPVPAGPSAGFMILLAAYVFGKGVLRHRAGRLVPDAGSLIPSALWPMHFFHARQQGDFVTVWRLNALTGSQHQVARMPVLDTRFLGLVEALPEFELMRKISPNYHIVSATTEGQATRLLCRDMRTRNFGTRFGDLEVWLDSGGRVIRSHFHV